MQHGNDFMISKTVKKNLMVRAWSLGLGLQLDWELGVNLQRRDEE